MGDEGLLGAPPGDLAPPGDIAPPGDNGPPGDSGPTGEGEGLSGESIPPRDGGMMEGGSGPDFESRQEMEAPGEKEGSGRMEEEDYTSRPMMDDMSGNNEGGKVARGSFEDDAPKEDMFAPQTPPDDHDEFNNQEGNNDGQDDFDLGDEMPTPVMAFAQPQEEQSQKEEYGASHKAEEYGDSGVNEYGDTGVKEYGDSGDKENGVSEAAEAGDGEPSESQDEVMPDEY